MTFAPSIITCNNHTLNKYDVCTKTRIKKFSGTHLITPSMSKNRKNLRIKIKPNDVILLINVASY